MSTDKIARPSRSRRRSPVVDPFRKVSYQMRTSVIEGVRNAVEQGAAASQNEFVERAIIRELRELRRAKVYAAYQEAANDPEFMADMRETTEAFDAALLDGLPDETE